MIKKALSFILAIVSCISLCIPVFAESPEEAIVQSGEEILSCYSGDVFYYDEETNSIEYLSQESEDDFTWFDPICLTLPANTSSSENEIQSVASDFINYYLVGGIVNVKNGTTTWEYTVAFTSSVHAIPSTRITVRLMASYTTKYGSYSTAASAMNDFTTKSDYESFYTLTAPAKTGYYYFDATVRNLDTGDSDRNQTNKELSNRSGKTWAYSYSAGGGKYLDLPRADWARETLYQRPKDLNKTYFNQYENETGISVDNQSDFHVHHQRPLFLGGSNDYDNLIHIPVDMHLSINGWYNGY